VVGAIAAPDCSGTKRAGGSPARGRSVRQGGTVMQQFFDQLLQFLQQGISAIFRFVQMIWAWSVSQISNLTYVPWQDWPLWKQIFLVLVIGGVAYALYKVAVELWQAGERILAAFATLLGVLVRTLPNVMIAGLIALGGLWVLNNIDFSRVPVPTFLQTTSVDQ
jgi:hypothetical protein